MFRHSMPRCLSTVFPNKAAMTITRAYKYLYYRIHKLNKATWLGLSEPPHLQNVSSMFALQSLNLFTLVLVIRKMTGVWYSPRTTELLVVLMVGLYALNYFCTAGHYRIIDEFEDESPALRRWGGVVFWIYLIGTFSACFGSLFWVFV